MEGLRAEPTTELLSEMEGFPGVWNEKTGKYGIRLQRNTLPDYATDDFWEAVSMWNDFQQFGFPEHGGKNDQGALWTDIVRLMQSCADKLREA